MLVFKAGIPQLVSVVFDMTAYSWRSYVLMFFGPLPAAVGECPIDGDSVIE